MLPLIWAMLHTGTSLVWIAALFYAAPLLARGEPLDVPARIRYTLVLACAIPLLLGAVGLFDAPALVIMTASLCALRYLVVRRAGRVRTDYVSTLIPLAAALLVASPNMVRPPLDGDTLGYHLPNAIAWVQAGSLQPTWMRYWWYPGASELTVAGVIQAGGLWIIGIASFLAVAMLVLRIAIWLQDAGVPRWTAVALSAAFIAMPVAAFQTYDARNDLVLAAWFIESLWMLRKHQPQAVIPLAILALIKPDGWVFVVIAVACMGKIRDLIALIPAAAWALHDIWLAGGAQISIASTTIASPFKTTIAANLAQALPLLGSVLFRQIATLCCFLAPLSALFYRDVRRIAAAAALCTLVFVVTPFSYANNLPQLANGSSLRFALPAIATGILVLAPLARRFPKLIAWIAVASAAFGIVHVVFVFANDAYAVAAFGSALLIAALALFRTRSRASAVPALIFGAVLLVVGAQAARVRAAAFYANEMPKIGGKPSAFFTWFYQHPHDAEVIEIRAGELLVLAPHARILDAAHVDCTRAHKERAWIIVGTDPDVSKTRRDRLMRSAQHCGAEVFRDPDVVAVAP